MFPCYTRCRVWDRGALVALRPEDREDYVRVCDSVLAPGGRVLLTTMVYDQSAKKGAHDFFPLQKHLKSLRFFVYFRADNRIQMHTCIVWSIRSRNHLREVPAAVGKRAKCRSCICAALGRG